MQKKQFAKLAAEVKDKKEKENDDELINHETINENSTENNGETKDNESDNANYMV